MSCRVRLAIGKSLLRLRLRRMGKGEAGSKAGGGPRGVVDTVRARPVEVVGLDGNVLHPPKERGHARPLPYVVRVERLAPPRKT